MSKTQLFRYIHQLESLEYLQKRGIGRPGFIYMLSEAAGEYFPNSYDNLVLGMLRDLRQHDGQEKIDQLFGWRRERLFKIKEQALSGKAGLDEILPALKQILETEGYFVELTRNGKYYYLNQYHCPIHKVAREFKEACRHELLLYRELLDRDVTRKQALSEEDAQSCLYVIPNA